MGQLEDLQRYVDKSNPNHNKSKAGDTSKADRKAGALKGGGGSNSPRRDLLDLSSDLSGLETAPVELRRWHNSVDLN
eukprot:1203811-Pyramimonas_sp.AAC.1